MPKTTHDEPTARHAPAPPDAAARNPVDGEGQPTVHPHPLSNDMTEETLPGRGDREQIGAKSGVGATPRRLVVVIGGIVLCLIAVGLIGSAAMLGERWQLVALGAIIAIAAVIIMSMPILLGAGTKVVQDEAVREAKTMAPKTTVHGDAESDKRGRPRA